MPEPRPKRLLAVLGQTATGKSSLGIALAERYDGEIINCDSTAVYRGFDIGTDKVPADARRGIPHHLIDIVDPTEDYTAAQYARDAARIADEIRVRGRVPIVVGGTGFYYRALTRGLFPGPGRDDRLRTRLRHIVARRGVQFLHRMLGRLDSASASRIQPRDEVRIVRALEVFFLTGRTLTDHFAGTVSPLEGWEIVAVALTQPMEELAPRLEARVQDQFERGLLDEMRAMLAAGVPETAHPFGGLVYRQALEYFHGVRDEGATRELIARENRKYARRQLIWFRKEPNLLWFRGPGTASGTFEQVAAALDTHFDLGSRNGRHAGAPRRGQSNPREETIP